MGSLLGGSLDVSAVSSVQSGESPDDSVLAGLVDLVQTVDHLYGVRGFFSQGLLGVVES